MNWKLKAKIQNLIGLLPPELSYSTYYYIQRTFGSLRDSKLSPISHLTAGIETINRIEQLNRSPVGASFLEVGTGRRINTILAFWLLGAEKVFTVDLNPYLKEELVKADLNYIAKNRLEIDSLFKSRIFDNRLDILFEFVKYPYQLKHLFKLINFEYIAPGDASNLKLPDNSIDYHTSYTVLEHISLATLRKIFFEGKRILKDDGLFIHKIDYSDHFSHSDKSISSINFLQFSDLEWDRIAGNRYAYTNRLRHDDFLNIFSELSAKLLLEENTFDDTVLRVLNLLHLNFVYAQKSEEVLKITSSWIVASI